MLQPEMDDETIGSGVLVATMVFCTGKEFSATFERLMENVLRGLSWQTCLVYFDDIIALGQNFDHHLNNLEKVFTRLQDANLKLNPKKWVNFLGQVVSDEGENQCNIGMAIT